MRDFITNDSGAPSQPERRLFMGTVAKFGFTAAVVGAVGGALFSESAMAATAKEESERENAAESTIVLATGYTLGASRAYPIMQLNFKENLQNFSRGKLYVRLQPGGQLGTGGAEGHAADSSRHGRTCGAVPGLRRVPRGARRRGVCERPSRAR